MHSSHPACNSFNKWIKKNLVFMSCYEILVLMTRNFRKWPAVIVRTTSSVAIQQTDSERRVLYLESCGFRSRYIYLLCGWANVGTVFRSRPRSLSPSSFQVHYLVSSQFFDVIYRVIIKWIRNVKWLYLLNGMLDSVLWPHYFSVEQFMKKYGLWKMEHHHVLCFMFEHGLKAILLVGGLGVED